MSLTVAELDEAVEDVMRMLTSETIRQRVTGVQRTRELFADPRVLDGVTDTGGPASWAHIWQSLEDAVNIEIDACTKRLARKPGSKAVAPASASDVNAKSVARVKELASLVSWLVETSVTCLARQSSRALLQHLVRVLSSHSGDIFLALLPSYLRALRTVLMWRPHVEHLQPAQWLALVGLLWNLIFGAKPNTALDPKLPDLTRYLASDIPSDLDSPLSRSWLNPTQTVNAFECLKEVFDGPCACFFLPGADGTPGSEERYGPALLDKFLYYIMHNSSQAPATLPMISALNVVLTALQLNERLAVSQFAAAAMPILTRLVITKNAALKEQLLISLDLLLPLLSTAPDLIPLIESGMEDSSTSQTRLQPKREWSIIHSKLADLQRTLLDEGAARYGLHPIKLSVLGLRPTPLDSSRGDDPPANENDEPQCKGTRYAGWWPAYRAHPGTLPQRIQNEHNPFYSVSFSAGFGFSESDHVSWLALELAACTTSYMLHASHQADVVTSSLTGSQRPTPLRGSQRSPSLSQQEKPAKRLRPSVSVVTTPKRLDGIAYLAATLQVTDAVTTPKRIWALQILTFWMDHFPSDLVTVIRHGSHLLNQLAEATYDLHEQVASWATVTLASAARALASAPRAADVQALAATVWEQVWPATAQRIAIPSLSRPSAALANALLSEGLVNSQSVPQIMTKIIMGLSSQAIAQPSESICELLFRALEILRMNRTGTNPAIGKSALGLVHRIWIPAFVYAQPLTSHDYELAAVQCSAVDFLPVLKALSGFSISQDPPLIVPRIVTARTATTKHLINKASTSRALKYMLFADVGDTRLRAKSGDTSTSSRRQPSADLNPLEEGHPASTLLLSLTNVLRVLHARMSTVEVDDKRGESRNKPRLGAAAFSALELKRTANAAVLGLLFSGATRQQGFRVQPDLAQMALDILEMTVVQASARRHVVTEKADILSGLMTLCIPDDLPAPCPMVSFPIARSLVVPGVLDTARNQQKRVSDTSLFKATFSAALDIPDVAPSLSALLHSLHELINSSISEAQLGDSLNAPAGHPDMDDLDFDEFGSERPVVGSNAQGHVLLDKILYGSVWYAFVTRLFGSVCMLDALKSSAGLASRKNTTSPALLLLKQPLDLSHVVILLPAANAADTHDLIHLNHDALAAFTDLVANQILSNYVYSRSPLAHQLALCLIRLGIRHMDFALQSRDLQLLTDWFLTKAHKRALSSWWVINDFADLLNDFLGQNELYDFWEPDNQCISKNDPAFVLMELMRHWDFRIRLHASTLMGVLFDQAANPTSDTEYEGGTFNAAMAKTSVNATLYERTLTSFAFFANSAIAAPMARVGAIASFLTVPYRMNGYGPYIKHFLVAIAYRLGFKDARDLFRAFNLYIVDELQSAGFEMISLEWELLGYHSAQEGIRDNMGMMGVAILMTSEEMGEPAYMLGQLCELADVPMDEYFDQTRPLLFTVVLGDWVFEASIGKQSKQAAWTQAVEFLRRAEMSFRPTQKKTETLICEVKDQIVAWLLRLTVIEQSAAMDDTDEVALTVARAGPGVAEFLKPFVEPYDDLPDTHPVPPPSRPQMSLSCLIDALLLMDSQVEGGIFTRSCCYHVINHLFTAIVDAKLTDRRVQLARVIPIFLGLYHTTLAETSLIFDTLLRRAALLLSDASLVPIIFPVTMNLWEIVAEHSDESCRIFRPETWLLSIVDAGFIVDGALKKTSRLMWSRAADYLTSLVAACCTKAPIVSDTALQVLFFWPDALAQAVLEQMQPKVPLSKYVRSMHTFPKLALNVQSLRHILDIIRDGHESAIQRFNTRGLWLLKRQLPQLRLGNARDLAQWGHFFTQILLVCGGYFVSPHADVWARLSSDRLQGNRLNCSAESGSGTTNLQSIMSPVLDTWLDHRSDTHERFFFGLRALVSELPKVEISGFQDNYIKDELGLLSAFPPNTRSKGEPLELKNVLDTCLESCQEEFSNWICTLTKGMSSSLIFTAPTSDFFARLVPLLDGRPELAEKLFAPLTLQILSDERKPQAGRSTPQSRSISAFFRAILAMDDIDGRIHALLVQCMLYLRVHDPARFALDVDYLILAQRALRGKLYSASLLFIELNRDRVSQAQVHRIHDLENELLHEIYRYIDDPDGFYSLPPLSGQSDDLLEVMRHEGRWQTAFEITAADHEVLQQTQLGGAPISSTAEPLHQLGFHSMASELLMTMQEADSPFGSQSAARPIRSESIKGDLRPYEIAWQASRWDIPAPRLATNHVTPGSGGCLYTALQCLHTLHSRSEVIPQVNEAQSTLLHGLASLPTEPSKALNATCIEMIGVGEVQRWLQLSRMHPLAMTSLSIMHHHLATEALDNMTSIEPEARLQMAQIRRALVQSVRAQYVKNSIGGWDDEDVRKAVLLESNLCRQISRLARDQQRLQVSMTMNKTIQQLERAVSTSEFASSLEFANMLWDYGQHSTAQKFLAGSLALKGENATDEQVGDALTQMAMWHSEARSEQPSVIEQKYFIKSLEYISHGHMNPQAQSRIYHRFATFSFSQYKRGQTDTDARQLRNFITKRSEELVQNEALNRSDMDQEALQALLLARNEARLTLSDDQRRLSTWEATQGTLLKYAMIMSARAVITSDLFDDSLLRFTSLWFEHADDEALNMALQEELEHIPSWKFVDLAHQISARLSIASVSHPSPRDVFHKMIWRTMYRMTGDHPFQTLYALYAMRSVGMENGEAAMETYRRQGMSAASQSQGVSRSQLTRAAAADEIWGKLMAHPDERRQAQMASMSLACDAYTEWAQFDLRSKGSRYYSGGAIKKGDLKMPKEVRLGTLKMLNIPVATAEVPIDKMGKYPKFVTINHYLPVFTTAGGVHLPKIVTCIGSDGKSYKQLFKDRDDLRQDAVMQQVFRLVNRLLAKDTRTRPRKLNIRTYLVRPLGERWGLLQFVDNTQPLYAVLNSLHTQFHNPRNKEMLPNEGRSAIQKAMTSDPEKRMKVYMDCAKRMPPAFRHFFTLTFKEPMAWFSSRLAYSRSLATTSIVGHVLGLGDRHVSNILIDMSVGELVHIDFGVAFDQGKLLRFPETIPFRLTRDMVDGLGLPGVDGAFRQCCQETLRVLRQGTELIKTILEVFKYDPLFTWTSNPVKVLQNEQRENLIVNGAGDEALQRLQDDPDAVEAGTKRGRRSRGNGAAASPYRQRSSFPSGLGVVSGGTTTAELAADRALATVLNKLSTSLSVEYSVNELIQQARSVQNLALLFSGWQALL